MSGRGGCCSARRGRGWVGAGASWSLWRGGGGRVWGGGGIRWGGGAGGVLRNPGAGGVRGLVYEKQFRGGVRGRGGGRPPMAVTDPDLVAALDALVDPISRGDPESPLR